MLTITQVVLFRDPRNSLELGRAIWASFQEIEKFYNIDKKRATFSRAFLSDRIPDELSNEFSAPFPLRLQPQRSDRQQSEARVRHARTFECSEIVGAVKETLAATKHRSPYLIVTDLELTPPREWRYIIFEADSEGTVVSKVPTDPTYWSQRDPDRTSTVKHRVRVACLNVVGTMLGLERCKNPECFLFDDIDSVSRLDGMVKLGSGHGMPALQGNGFETRVSNPDVPQPIRADPDPIEAP